MKDAMQAFVNNAMGVVGAMLALFVMLKIFQWATAPKEAKSADEQPAE